MWVHFTWTLETFGFFGNLSDDAIVRNIKFATSIGLKSSTRPGTNLFAGGVAGKAGSALLVNVEASANISVDIPTFDTNVYSGTVVGYGDGLTIDSICIEHTVIFEKVRIGDGQ